LPPHSHYSSFNTSLPRYTKEPDEQGRGEAAFSPRLFAAKIPKGVFENSLEREISNKTAAMIVELARRFALESSFQTRPKVKIKIKVKTLGALPPIPRKGLRTPSFARQAQRSYAVCGVWSHGVALHIKIVILHAQRFYALLRRM
jgi:hypothetical protein